MYLDSESYKVRFPNRLVLFFCVSHRVQVPVLWKHYHHVNSCHAVLWIGILLMPVRIRRSKLLFLIKKYLTKFFTCKFFQNPESGLGLVFSLKCWIRNRNQ